jgi:hypothetical protein
VSGDAVFPANASLPPARPLPWNYLLAPDKKDEKVINNEEERKKERKERKMGVSKYCTLLQWYPLRACTLLQWYPLSVCCCLQKGLGATGLPDSDFCLYQRTFLNNFSTLFHLIHFWRIFFFASFSFLSPTSFLCGKCTRILGVYPSKSAQRRELFK